jgi:hypothetical protein
MMIRKKRARKDNVSIMVRDHCSTVPNARGENSRIKINMIKIMLDTDRFSL